MLQVDGVSFQIGAYTLIDRFTVQFAAGELVMLVGPNGAGKTTLLRCLDGELSPTYGHVILAGKPLGTWSHHELARRRAVLPQQSTLDFRFTVYDVILMGRIPHLTSDAENCAIAKIVIELCGCTDLSERDYTSLSGGEQQRVQTARVLAQIYDSSASQERFLLLDEPVSALDLNHQYALMRLLTRLKSEQKIGIVCAMHNLNLVAQFADRAVVMERGIMVADGAPIDVFTEETISNVFDLEVSVQPHPEDASIPLLIPKLSQNAPDRFARTGRKCS